MIVCRRCGQQLTDEAVFCWECGEKVEKALPRPVCSRCGAELREGSLFCIKCGQRVNTKPEKPVVHTCKKCGAELPEGSLFCIKCGQRVEAEPEAPVIPTCKKCGAELPEGSLFCIKCGQRVEAEPKAPAVSICKKCGEELPDGSAFCVFCGHKTGEEIPGAAPVPAEEQPAPAEEQSATVEEQPVLAEEQSAPAKEQPAPVGEPPVSKEELKKLSDQADSFYQSGNYEQALDLWQSAFKLAPSSAAVTYQIGECYRNLNDFDHAKEYYIRSGELGNTDGYARVGYLYHAGTFAAWTIKRVDDPRQAIQWYMRSIEGAGEDEKRKIRSRLNNIGCCYDRLNEPFKAALYTWTAYQYEQNQTVMDNYRTFSAKLTSAQRFMIESVHNRADMEKLLAPVERTVRSAPAAAPKPAPAPAKKAGDFSMKIGEAFPVPGRGMSVTGILDGTVNVGDSVGMYTEAGEKENVFTVAGIEHFRKLFDTMTGPDENGSVVGVGLLFRGTDTMNPGYFKGKLLATDSRAPRAVSAAARQSAPETVPQNPAGGNGEPVARAEEGSIIYFVGEDPRSQKMVHLHAYGDRLQIKVQKENTGSMILRSQGGLIGRAIANKKAGSANVEYVSSEDVFYRDMKNVDVKGRGRFIIHMKNGKKLSFSLDEVGVRNTHAGENFQKVAQTVLSHVD